MEGYHVRLDSHDVIFAAVYAIFYESHGQKKKGWQIGLDSD